MTLQYSIGIGFDGGSTVKATCRLWNGKITKYGTATAVLSIPQNITVTADLAWGFGSTTIDVTATIGSTSYTKALSLSGTVNATGVASNAANAVINTVNNSFTANAYSSGSASFVTYTSITGSANGGAGSYTMHYDNRTVTLAVTPGLDSIGISTKISGTEVLNGDLSIRMTKGTPASTGGKAAAWAGSTKIGEIDIDDWWTGGYNAADAASVAVQGTPGATATSIFVTVTRGDGTAHSNLSLNVSTFREAVYNKGWNDCVAAMEQITNAYNDPGTETVNVSYSVNAYDSSGKSKTYTGTVSHTQPKAVGSARTDCYKKPATK